MLLLALFAAACTTLRTARAPEPGQRATVFRLDAAAATVAIARHLETRSDVQDVRPEPGAGAGEPVVEFVHAGFAGVVRLRCLAEENGAAAGWWPTIELSGTRRLLGPARTVRVLGFIGALPAGLAGALSEAGKALEQAPGSGGGRILTLRRPGSVEADRCRGAEQNYS